MERQSTGVINGKVIKKKYESAENQINEESSSAEEYQNQTEEENERQFLNKRGRG